MLHSLGQLLCLHSQVVQSRYRHLETQVQFMSLSEKSHLDVHNTVGLIECPG